MSSMEEPFETSPRERVGIFLSRLRESGLGVTSFVPLSGDASNRLYYRLQLTFGGSLVLVVLPGPFEEERLPFLNVAELFAAMGIPVPRVERVCGSLGMLLLEDLGDRLLQEGVRCASPERRRALYLEAVSILARLQLEAEAHRDERYLPFVTAFDAEKFRFELDFFRRHFLEGLRGNSLAPEELEQLEHEFGRLSSELAGHPFVLCHRDYHSRNLMLTPKGLVLIDFQDARMGPRSYDLVSLVNDSYVTHSDELAHEIRQAFEAAVGANLEREYDPAALQRNLKALGTFGFQIAQRGNEVYRQYVEHTLALVRGNLERNRRWEGLRRVLARHLPELE